MTTSKLLNKSKHTTSIPLILKIGGVLEKATMHKKGYLQIPIDAEGHKDLIATIECAQFTIIRGISGIGHALAVGEDVVEYAYDLGWLLNGLGDLSTELSITKEQIEESQRHLLDKDETR